MPYLFFLIGFCIHVARDFQRVKEDFFFWEYYRNNKIDIITTLIISGCIVVAIDIEASLTNITALVMGYAGDSFFRFLIKSKTGE